MIDEKKLKGDVSNYFIKRIAETTIFKITRKRIEQIIKVNDDIFNIIESQPQADGWILCEERLPDTYDNLLICQSDGYVNVGYYSLNEFKDMNSYPYKDVIAWQPLPQPYKKEGAE